MTEASFHQIDRIRIAKSVEMVNKYERKCYFAGKRKYYNKSIRTGKPEQVVLQNKN